MPNGTLARPGTFEDSWGGKLYTGYEGRTVGTTC